MSNTVSAETSIHDSPDPALAALIGKVRAVAESMETGAASTPQSDRIRALLESGGSRPLRVVVLALSLEARQVALQLLLGAEASFHLLKVVSSPRAGVIELHLQERGYVIDDGRSRQEFDSIDIFLDRLQRTEFGLNSSPGEFVAPLKLGLSAPAGRHGMVLVVPEDIKRLIKHPEVTSGLSQAGDALLLAGMAGDEAPVGTDEVLSVLASGIPVAQALVVNAPETSEPTPFLSACTALLHPEIRIPDARARFTVSGVPQLDTGDSLLAEDRPMFRKLLSNLRLAREADSVVSSLRQTSCKEADRLTERRRVIEIPATAPSDPGFRILAEQITSSLQNDVAALMKHSEEASRQSLMPKGTFFDLIRKTAEGLNSDQLSATPIHKAMRLEVGEDLTRRLRDPILDQLVSDITRQQELLSEAMAASAEAVSQRLSVATASSVALKAPRYDVTRLLDFATTSADCPLSLRAEVPRLTTGQFVWTCFQHPVMILFTIMMPMSLFMASPELGPMLRNIRFDVALYGLVPMYIATPFILRNKHRKEVAAAMDREMERLRNGLQADLDRIARSGTEERRRVMADWLKVAAEDLRRQAIAFLADVSRSEERKRAEEKQTQAATLQRLDSRLREITQTIQQCDQLERETRQTRHTTTLNLGVALKESNSRRLGS